MKELISYIISELVEKKDEVEITEDDLHIKITLAKSDMGKVIGRHGKIIKAVRSIVKAAGQKDNKKYVVDVIERE
jgi:predicted RNA-binding protein YlqC (UPF0109 family)